METITKFLSVGDSTTCADVDFMQQVRDNLELFQNYPSAQAISDAMRNLWESQTRCEYSVRDENGKLKALMIIVKDDFDYHIGQPCLVVEFACSFDKGLLRGAYKWLKTLAKENGLKWILQTRTNGNQINTRYVQVK